MLVKRNRPRAFEQRAGLSFLHRMTHSMVRAILAASAGAHVVLWLAMWRFLRRTQHEWSKAVIVSTAAPRIGLALSFLGYAGWLLGSLGYAANPRWPFFHPLSPRLFWPRAGLGLLFIGHGLVVWAALSLGPSFGLRPRIIAEHRLVRHGPYRFVRHPLYTGLHALDLGTFVLAPCALFLLSLIAAVVGNTMRARAEERVLLARYGDAYRAYARSVGRFLPKVRRFNRRCAPPPPG